MKIKYIDGKRLSRAIMAGAKRVFQRTDHLNKINFFPVPDADTGSNISSTFKSIVNGLNQDPDDRVKTTSKVAADAALLGAHGNSGVIFAQFFYGVYKEMEDSHVLTTEKFGKAVKNSVHYVYDALSEPKDGTIISVIRDWANGIYKHRKEKQDFVELWKHGIEVAQESLESTRERIESRAVEVVDAGAQGFVDFLEGIYKFISKGKIKELDSDIERVPDFNVEADDHSAESLKEINFRYCTEFLIKGENLNTNQIKVSLENIGDSIVVAGSDNIARIHVHTNQPSEAMEIVSASAREIAEQKVDDMKIEYIDGNTEHGEIALVTDTACNLPQHIIDNYNIHQIPFNVILKGTKFLDTFTLSKEHFYKRMNQTEQLSKTSQPSPALFKKMYKFLLKHYKSVISIHLSSPLSGAFQAAQNSASEFDGKVKVIDSKNLTVAEGLLVEKAAQMIEKGHDTDTIIQQLETGRDNLQLFVSVPDIKTLMKSGRVSKAKSFLAKIFNIKPILKIDKEGKPVHGDKAFTKAGLPKKLTSLVEKDLEGKKNLKFLIAHADALETAQFYAEFIQEKYNKDVEIVEAAPVLASHTGLGTAAIGVLWED